MLIENLNGNFHLSFFTLLRRRFRKKLIDEKRLSNKIVNYILKTPNTNKKKVLLFDAKKVFLNNLKSQKKDNNHVYS